MADNDGDERAQANSVSIKMPQFMETAASGWFQILEAQFHLKNIRSEETKYFHVIAALPPDLIAKLPHTLLENKAFKELKEAVISLHEKTKPELFSKLISKTTMSGRPSFYLQELTSIASKVGVGEDLIRHQFIQALPPTISPVLAAQKDLTMHQLGNLADELSPLLQNPLLNVQSQKPHRSNSYQRSPQNSFSQNNGRNTNNIGLQPFSKDQRPKVCRGHIFFAEKSRTCKPWCRWPNKNKCAMQPNSRASSPTPSMNSEN